MSLFERTLSKKNCYPDKMYPESKIIPITNDRMFQSIFNNKSRKKYVCYFLSTFLGLDYNDLYNNINLENDVLPKEFKESQNRIVDFVCKYNDEFYLIEMNNQSNIDYLKRNIDSMHRLYGFPTEKEGYIFNKVTLINVNNFSFNSEEVNKYLYKDLNNDVLTDECYYSQSKRQNIHKHKNIAL